MFKNSQKIAISKRFLIAALFIVLMFTSFGVCMDDAYASDLNESAGVIKSELNVEDKLENSQDSILNSDDVEENFLGGVLNDEILGETYMLDGGTFKDITRAINKANSGDTIQLSGTFYPSVDGERVSINKTVTITSDSQAVLDGKNVSRIFYVRENATGAVIKNLKFINGYSSSNGGGIYVATNNVSIYNCVFEFNSADNGGAIYSSYNDTIAENLLVENCTFYKNHGYRSAGAIGVFGNNSTVKNCIFDSNYADSGGEIINYGGAIQIGLNDPVSVGLVDNCIFLNNYVNGANESSHAGAGCARTGSAYQNCIFINNSAPQGGALTYHASGLLKNCTFINNSAVFYGGALSTGYSDMIMDLNIENCSFINNSAPFGGAAQLIGQNIRIHDSNFDGNKVTQTGGAINIVAESVTVDSSAFKGNIANVDGGAIFIDGTNTLIQDSLFEGNEAIPDVNKLDDGLGGAIYINSTQATVNNNEFYYNTARNGSAVYYDKSGDDLRLNNNTFYENQAWVYALLIYADDIYYGEVEQFKSIIRGGNNIGDYDNLAVSNAIYNAAVNQNIVIDGETPVSGATTSGRLYQDDREYNIEVLMTVVYEDGSVVYNDTLNSSCFGEVSDNLTNLKVGKYFVTAKHFEDNYYKAITNTTSFNVIAHVDVKVKKSVNNTELNYGNVVLWTLNITNDGPNNATNVTVTDILPEGLIWLDDDTDGKYDCQTGSLKLDFLGIGDVVVVNIITLVNKTGTIVNSVNVTSHEADDNITNNFDNETIEVSPASDLAVVKVADNTAPDYNGLVKWTITVTNNGPDVAHDVMVWDVLPESLIWLNDTSSGKYSPDSGVWDIGLLENGAEITLEIITKVNRTGSIMNDVSVSANEYDYNESNNADSQTIKVANATDLSVVKLVNDSIGNYHGLIKWTIIASNNGPDNATGVYVMDILPDGLILVNYSASKGFYDNGMWSICCIESGDVQTLDIECYINKTGEIMNSANITGNEYDYDLSNNAANESIIVPDASCDLAVVKTVNETNPFFGDIVEWKITINNNGPDAANEIYVFDELPYGLKYLNYVASKGIYDEDGMWYVPSLDNGESAYLLIRCEVNSLEDMINAASASSLEYDWNKSNNNDSEMIFPNPLADLSIIKSANVTQAHYMDLVEWTLTVTNNGPNDASDVIVSDVLSDAFQLIETEGDGEYVDSVWHIPILKSGESRMLKLICRAIETGEFENAADVEANEYDPDLSNNHDEKSLLVVESDNNDSDSDDDGEDIVDVIENLDKNNILETCHEFSSDNKMEGSHQSMLQKYPAGNPLAMMIVSVVILLLINCGISFSKKR